MKCAIVTTVAAAAILSAGTLVALADNLPERHPVAEHKVPVAKQKVVARYRYHEHRYHEAWCEHHHYRHHYVEVPEYYRHHRYARAHHYDEHDDD